MSQRGREDMQPAKAIFFIKWKSHVNWSMYQEVSAALEDMIVAIEGEL